MTILSKHAIFRPKTELEVIARWSVEALRKVDFAYFGNIGRNSGYFLLPIFLGSYLTVHPGASPIDFHSKHRAASVVFAPLLTASGQGMGSFSC